ncbi:MAG: glycosyltransferase family 4 protein [Pseudomonadota bacterium]
MTSGPIVLQVVPKLDAGGAERTTLEMTRAIVAAGGKAFVASHGGRLAADIEAAGGRNVQMPVHSKAPLQWWLNAGRLADLIRREKIDIVHARSRAPAWSALWAARRTGAAFVTTYHGAYRAKNALKRFYNSSMIRGDKVIANSRFTAASIRAQYDLPEDRLVVIPRGADLQEFNPARVNEARVARLVENWGLKPGNRSTGAGLRVLLPARISEWKGHRVAIEAVSLLRRATKPGGASGLGGDLTLVFAGGAHGAGDFLTVLRAFVEQSGVLDMVHFVGDCADMPAAYRWSDVVLAPSTRPEAFGRVAVEAGAMGKPVIAADHGGAAETVIDGETGFLTAPGDAGALADAILAVHALDEGGRARIGEQARARVASLYSTRAMCDATLRVYEGLMTHRLQS